MWCARDPIAILLPETTGTHKDISYAFYVPKSMVILASNCLALRLGILCA